MPEDDLQEYQGPERRHNYPESQVSKANDWFDLAKNLVWVIVILLVGVFKYNELVTTNAMQDEKIKGLQATIQAVADSNNANVKDITARLGKLDDSNTQILIAIAKLTEQLSKRNPKDGY